jgi:hypothetical protein
MIAEDIRRYDIGKSGVRNRCLQERNIPEAHRAGVKFRFL